MEGIKIHANISELGLDNEATLKIFEDGARPVQQRFRKMGLLLHACCIGLEVSVGPWSSSFFFFFNLYP